MDSLTQIVLGAAVGEAVCGRKAGNKALIWGAVAGTIPDLDVLANPFLGIVEEISWHRSATHSFLFAIVVSPILGWLLRKIYLKSEATFRDWTLLFFLGFVTHAILDSFTTWGTQLFWPFSPYGVAFYNVFVIDPFYTLPFLLFVILAATRRKEDRKRRLYNNFGLFISSAYLVFTFLAKSYANMIFEKNLQEQGIAYIDYISKPTPLNAILWAITAKTDSGFYNGYYSLLDDNEKVQFEYSEQDAQLLAPYLDNEKLQRLLYVTKGYYTVDKTGDTLLINDFRFGKFKNWKSGKSESVFTFTLTETPEGLQFGQQEFGYRPTGADMKAFLNRILGQEEENSNL